MMPVTPPRKPTFPAHSRRWPFPHSLTKRPSYTSRSWAKIAARLSRCSVNTVPKSFIASTLPASFGNKLAGPWRDWNPEASVWGVKLDNG
jgi:hypothetical protein